MKKRIIQIVLFVSIFCITALPTYATDRNEAIIIRPYWTEISQFNNSFNITSSGRADIESTLIAFDVDTIGIEAHLQQFINGSWVTIKTWTEVSTDEICTAAGSWYVQKGYYYRLFSTGTVYKDGRQFEQVDYTSIGKWY